MRKVQRNRNSPMSSAHMRGKLTLANCAKGLERTLCNRGSLSNYLFMRKLPDTQSAQKILRDGLARKDNFLLLRFGLYEYQLCYQFLEKINGLRRAYSDDLLYHLPMDTGLFGPDEHCYDRYARLIISSLDEVDVLAYWRNIPSPFLFSGFYSNAVQHINVEDLYPYPFWHHRDLPNWQSSLMGKKVLVVSSFAETIRRQYQKREEIWKQVDILPAFELIAFQAVQTNGGNTAPGFDSWVDAVRHMAADISNIDFDIALISCGGYGMPLALELHKAGKKAIQWGGCSQLWFGIMGGRWCNDPDIISYFNSAWTYPSPCETPLLSHLVDHSSYWRP